MKIRRLNDFSLAPAYERITSSKNGTLYLQHYVEMEMTLSNLMCSMEAMAINQLSEIAKAYTDSNVCSLFRIRS
jgi:hypothetical protein